MKVRGFTIAEALVVLVIIAIMSYLLYPLFMKVKRQVQIRSSIGKLRQIHIAIENYRQAWDGADVFTSYRSYYRLGLPATPRDQGIVYPWIRTGTDYRDWWSPCATGILAYDEEIMKDVFLPHVPAGYIGLVCIVYSPTVIEYPVPGGTNFNKLYYSDYIPRYRQNIVIAIDPYCNPPGTKMNAPLVFKRGLALLLSGQVVNRYAQGNAFFLQWWSDPPED
jgi:type II secretory pathway pseudopilin PulG